MNKSSCTAKAIPIHSSKYRAQSGTSKNRHNIFIATQHISQIIANTLFRLFRKFKGRSGIKIFYFRFILIQQINKQTSI